MNIGFPWHDKVREIPPLNLLPERLHEAAEALSELRDEYYVMRDEHAEQFNANQLKAAEKRDVDALLAAAHPEKHNATAHVNVFTANKARSEEALAAKKAELDRAEAAWTEAMRESVVERFDLADPLIDPAVEEYEAAIAALEQARAKYMDAMDTARVIAQEADEVAYASRFAQGESAPPYTNGAGNFHLHAGLRRGGSNEMPLVSNNMKRATFAEILFGLRWDAKRNVQVSPRQPNVDELEMARWLERAHWDRYQDERFVFRRKPKAS